MSVTIIDNWATPSLIEAVKASWPDQSWGGWFVYESGKMASKSPVGFPRSVDFLISQMCEINFPRCFPDLDWMHGAGLHQMSAGNSLGPHLDAEYHPNKPWRREISMILYLDDCDGGALQMTDDVGRVHRTIESKQNRLVWFNTPGQWHHVTECYSIRRSIGLFWWSICDEVQPISTRAKFMAGATH